MTSFPHGGDYQIDLTVTPPGEPAFNVSFKVSVGGGMGGMQMGGMEMMHMMEPFAGVPHTREASGTSWQPDSTPMHGDHRMIGRGPETLSCPPNSGAMSRVPDQAVASFCQSTGCPSFSGVPASGIGYLSPVAQLNSTARSPGPTRPSAIACL